MSRLNAPSGPRTGIQVVALLLACSVGAEGCSTKGGTVEAEWGTLVFFRDVDGDGYGSAADDVEVVYTSGPPGGYVDNRWDCDDAHASVNARAREVCDDGLDDDCDGLLDCEDEDCSALARCAESACADGVDDDDDSYLDCEDEDCWGVAACEDARRVHARILSAPHFEEHWSLVLSRGSLLHTVEGSADSVISVITVGSVVSSSNSHWTGSNVTGTVRVEGSDGVATCAWGFDQVSTRVARRRATMSGELVLNTQRSSSERDGFWIEPGCELTNSDFLPRISQQEASFFSVRGGGWYVPGYSFAGSTSATEANDPDLPGWYDEGPGVFTVLGDLAEMWSSYSGSLSSGATFTRVEAE